MSGIIAGICASRVSRPFAELSVRARTVGAVAKRGHGGIPPETHRSVRSADWDGEDLSGQEHHQVEFVDVDLTEALLTGASLGGRT